jgi:hypothetical protein
MRPVIFIFSAGVFADALALMQSCWNPSRTAIRKMAARGAILASRMTA